MKLQLTKVRSERPCDKAHDLDEPARIPTYQISTTIACYILMQVNTDFSSIFRHFSCL